MDKKKSLLLLTAAAAGTVIYNIWKPVKSTLPVIKDFELEKYLGEWYEIARLDFFWEKGLKNVKANYSLNEDGSIKVINSGVKIKDNKLKQSVGKAKFLGEPNEGALKVSFFGPFYSGYNIMHIGGNYEYALVFGENLDYMWILSRTKTITPELQAKYLEYARTAGYAVEELVWTIQE
ncbi:MULTISPECIES: lipocalin family protein [Sphingobacterium]|jgi:apolipoprotein D and lipocalin family protein|uniref:Lipocalin family protein n=1 Tax=Sphingobacterium litopenaei TaxID=2763500 RepID=A0ABR7YAV6_9SPHI|nr:MULTISPECIES: lipocalin family protein [Sphingobacterium]MBD1428422.1 lipocalin family protein [Sphingobacterium litopenaei]NGM71774.1 lipocalin [Sphingobacterium sp. SGL-16]